MRAMPSALPVVLAGGLMFGAAACTAESTPSAAPSKSGLIAADCLDLEHGSAHLTLDMVDGLHPLDPDQAALNNDYSARDGITVQQLAWVLLGARSQRNADGVLVVYATDRTARFPAVESMQRTIVESSGPNVRVSDLELDRARVAGQVAETAAVASDNGEYDAWTFTSGKTRFIVVTRQQLGRGPFDLSERVPDLLSARGCPDA